MSEGGKGFGPRQRQVPPGDDRTRLVCPDCGFVAYENPRIVVGAVARRGQHILLCRRAIEPRIGYWTLPAGYLELNESTAAGAKREAWEEAFAQLALGDVLAVYSITHIHQVQIIYRARLLNSDIAPGEESQQVALFAWDELPWQELAFPSVRWALEQEHACRDAASIAARGNPEPPQPITPRE